MATSSGLCPECEVVCAVGITVERVDDAFDCPGCGVELRFHETDRGRWLYYADLGED